MSSPSKAYPPGPRGLPILGQALRYQRDPFGYFLWLRQNYGDVSRDASSKLPLVHVFAPSAIEHVLVRNAKNYLKDRILKSWDLVFGEGLLTAEGEKWKRDRRLIQPAFHRSRLEGYEELMLVNSQRILSDPVWKLGGRIDALSQMTELTLRIALDSLFGRAFNEEVGREELAQLRDIQKPILDWFEFSSGAFLALVFLFPWFPFPNRLRYERAVAQVDGFVERIIQRKRMELATSQNAASDLLGALLTAADTDGTAAAFTNQQVRDHALTFLLAGHETTALALSYTIRLLALHPGIQERLRRDLRQRTRDGVTLTALEESALLANVLDESLRLFPPASVTAREAVADDIIDGYQVDAGATVVIPIWAIHRDPRFFGREVESFDPDRWTPEMRKALPRSAFLPFGFGPRMCIGAGFAMQELKIVLAELLRRYQFTMDPADQGIRLQPSITMRPRDPVWIRVSSAP